MSGTACSACKTEGPDVSVAEVRGLDGQIHPYLSTDPAENTASIAAQALMNDHGGSFGVELKVHKGVPLQSGMGSSAASAVAGSRSGECSFGYTAGNRGVAALRTGRREGTRVAACTPTMSLQVCLAG